ncbi:MAG: hypothetical protein DCF16_10370 [Alphaproteobacteria bacterium]|nr:MAG: hypothetical protein DCF16_10370 [Alphaproteobacteria bacterium]
MPGLTERTAVERHVLRYHQDVAATNAAVGDEPITYTLERTHDLHVYRQIIAPRFHQDMRDQYPQGVRSATRVFLLLGERGDLDIVQLIRLGSTAPDGAFERIEGVTYVFDRTSHALLTLRGTEY